jgi:hypothetical protein
VRLLPEVFALARDNRADNRADSPYSSIFINEFLPQKRRRSVRTFESTDSSSFANAEDIAFRHLAAGRSARTSSNGSAILAITFDSDSGDGDPPVNEGATHPPALDGSTQNCAAINVLPAARNIRARGEGRGQGGKQNAAERLTRREIERH